MQTNLATVGLSRRTSMIYLRMIQTRMIVRAVVCRIVGSGVLAKWAPHQVLSREHVQNHHGHRRYKKIPWCCVAEYLNDTLFGLLPLRNLPANQSINQLCVLRSLFRFWSIPPRERISFCSSIPRPPVSVMPAFKELLLNAFSRRLATTGLE